MNLLDRSYTGPPGEVCEGVSTYEGLVADATSSVPVHVGDVTGRSSADPNPLGAQDIVDVHKAVM